MLIYDYDPKTMEYIGGNGRQAKKSPLDDEWLIPAFSTPIAPPAFQSNFARCFLNGQWVQIPDYRGKTVYNIETKKEKKIEELGDIPQGYTLEKPESEFDEWVDDEWVPDEEAIKLKQKNDAINFIQSILDNKAKEYGFDNIHTANGWINSNNINRRLRARSLHDWGDAVWDFAETEWENQVMGNPTYTDIESFVADLPQFVFYTEEPE